MGLPVSVPALGVYLSLLVLTFPASKVAADPLRRRAIFSLAALIVASIAWFGFVQEVIIRHWCKFCLATHFAALAAVICLIVAARRKTVEGAEQGIGQRGDAAIIGVTAFAGLALLIAGQTFVRKTLYRVTQVSANPPAASAGTLRLFNDQFHLDPDDLPLIGTSVSSNYMISLFDYTCSHCRKLHPLLRNLARAYTGQLAIISLPVPLDAECNPLLKETAEANAHACDYARLGLAVFHTRPSAFSEFDDWMFDSEPTPTLEAAREKAGDLVGKSELAAALSSPWVQQQMKTDVDLYIIDSKAIRNARLPQLLFGTAAIAGSIETMDDLMRVFHEQQLLRRRAGH